jgi:hypothetical protein
MANIQPPKKKATKGLPPLADKPSNNLTKIESSELTPMNFKVPPDFHREFKTYAVQHDMTMVQLLEACFNLYKENTK